jgi:hypothetical protein
MDVIYAYTRAQALSDGVLVDVTQNAREAGIRHPTALTRSVWERYVRVPERTSCQDEQGRLWDVLWMFRLAALAASDECMVTFQVLVNNDDAEGPRPVTLKSVCGPGDDLEPVITIMLPEED